MMTPAAKTTTFMFEQSYIHNCNYQRTQAGKRKKTKTDSKDDKLNKDGKTCCFFFQDFMATVTEA